MTDRSPDPEEEAPVLDPEPQTSETAGMVEIPLDDFDGDSQTAGEEIVAALARIDDRLAESQRLIGRHADVAAKLHAENQALRSGELRAAQTALVNSVIRVHDDVAQMAAATEEGARRDDLELVADALADALARNGVEAIAPAAGEPLDSGRHRIAEVRETEDPGADRTVAAVLRVGFAWTDGATVRLSDVAVHKHTPPAAGAADDQND